MTTHTTAPSARATTTRAAGDPPAAPDPDPDPDFSTRTAPDATPARQGLARDGSRRSSAWRRWWRTPRGALVRSYAEMLAAMVVGMLLLAPVWQLILSATALARVDVGVSVMAVDMAIGMAVWMAVRGCSRRATVEMSAAMVVSMLVPLVPWAFGVASADAVMIVGHVLMLPAMAIVLLRHRAEHVHAGHDEPGQRPRTPGRFGVLLRRWPMLVALVVTADNWVNPGPPPAELLLVLPLGYLLIGGARGELWSRREFALQLAQLVAWGAIVAAALAAGPDAARWLIGLGWLAHGAWDIWHHYRNRVVPRGYAEWCLVVDIVVGVTTIALV